MNLDNVKNILQEISDNPDIVADETDEMERLLKGVIKIEKRHMYGLETTSTAKRREEIYKYLHKELLE